MTVYRFKSRETKDLVMMEGQARRILDLLGKDLQSGIIQASEMAAAAKVLTDAAIAEELLQPPGDGDSKEASEDDNQVDSESIGLRKRIAPFLEMLRRCEAAQVSVVWGV